MGVVSQADYIFQTQDGKYIFQSTENINEFDQALVECFRFDTGVTTSKDAAATPNDRIDRVDSLIGTGNYLFAASLTTRPILKANVLGGKPAAYINVNGDGTTNSNQEYFRIAVSIRARTVVMIWKGFLGRADCGLLGQFGSGQDFKNRADSGTNIVANIQSDNGFFTTPVYFNTASPGKMHQVQRPTSWVMMTGLADIETTYNNIALLGGYARSAYVMCLAEIRFYNKYPSYNEIKLLYEDRKAFYNSAI